MRDFKGMKRQRNRNRNGGGGGGKPQHNANRAFDSNGPEGVKVRGAAQHVYEKYQQLARDATTSGDRVLAENYLQHAEHYFRVMRAMQPQRPVAEIIGRDQFVSGFDIDFEEEPQVTEAAEPEADGESAEGLEADRGFRPEGRREDGRQGEYRQGEPRSRDRDEGYRGDRAQGERQFGDRGQSDRFGQERPRDERGPRGARDDRPRFQREDRGPRPERVERPERGEADPLGVVEPEATPLTSAPSEPAPILRADDGEVSHAPAFLQPRVREPRAEGEERRPRRRRTAAAAPQDQTASEDEA
ncbi:MAG: DUF4167 domain-containing protein [Caulobacteraceae bacterium]|nr:DUF4167 domain-containing protein [Caulobacteraceae bacterium]